MCAHAHLQSCQPAVDGHSNKARVHKQRARLFGLAGAKRWRVNKMTWLQRRWGERSSVSVVFQRESVWCVYASVRQLWWWSLSTHSLYIIPFSRPHSFSFVEYTHMQNITAVKRWENEALFHRITAFSSLLATAISQVLSRAALKTKAACLKNSKVL